MWIHKHHEEIEKLICSKCPADINKDYSPCKNCKRGDDFELGYEAGLHADVHTDNSAVIAKLEAQIEKMEQNLDNARENANKQEQLEIYSVLNDIFNYNNELKLKIIEPRKKRIAELEAQIDEMKKELHHRLVSPSKSDSDCLDKIIGLDRLWQFGEEF